MMPMDENFSCSEEELCRLLDGKAKCLGDECKAFSKNFK